MSKGVQLMTVFHNTLVIKTVTLRTATFVSHVVPYFPLLIDDSRDLVHTELDALFLDDLSESITKRVPGWLEKMELIDVNDSSDKDLWKEGKLAVHIYTYRVSASTCTALC